MRAAFINPLAPRSSAIIEQARIVKAYVRAILHLEDEVVVSVNELSCNLPNCPPKETVILIMSDGVTRQISIHKALAAIDRDEILSVCMQDNLIDSTKKSNVGFQDNIGLK